MRYVALLRGIGPTNPNMKGERLKSVFQELGFTNVHPVIASGNVIFDSSAKNAKALEARIEKALPERLGFSSTTIIRARADLEGLVQKRPFAGVRDEKPNYLLVTFFKDRRPELCKVIKLTEGNTPDFMRELERQHGKALTSRTWKTVARILKKMDESETDPRLKRV